MMKGGECNMHTIQEVADILYMSYGGVLRLVRLGRIKAVKVGKRYLVSDDEIARIKREGA
jgi:excisionase family DNA binding protein